MNSETRRRHKFLRNIAQDGEPSIAIRQQANMRVEKKLIPRKSFGIHNLLDI